ncbi:MAG: AAA family ATPase, partial [Pseudomonadales bacterium]|nr:AAA family ATPase [Pseudomonadales bacterium]
MNHQVLLKSICLKNFLSYGPESKPVELSPLNIVIGPNGSGKSNLIEAVELIRSAPKDLLTPVREGGGIRDWLWKGGASIPTPTATLDAVFNNPKSSAKLRYLLSFTEVAQRFEIVDERIENEKPDTGHKAPYLYYRYENGHGVLNVKGERRKLQHEDIDTTSSILAQRKDPDQYPEITHLGAAFSKIRLYREWTFGRYTPPRLPQKADMPNDYLEPDCRNLGLVLNRIG